MSDGIMNKYEVVDRIIVTLNRVSVTGAKNVLALGNVFQMLSVLKDGMKEEEDSKNRIIESLKTQLKHATEPDKDGEVIGGEHYDFNFGGAENGKD